MPFENDTIHAFYNLPKVDNQAYENLRKEPNYSDIINCLTNNQEKSKINHEGQVVNLKAKVLFYIPMIWHHFITSRILPAYDFGKRTGRTSNIVDQKSK